MVIDHIDHLWLQREVHMFFFIGRATFPLFCYGVATALIRAESEEKVFRYVKIMIVLALISEPISEFVRQQSLMNVIFTLAAGAVFATMAEKMKSAHVMLCYAAAMAVSLCMALPIEFGLTGVVLPSAFLMVLRGRKGFGIWLFLLLLTVNQTGFVAQAMDLAPGTGMGAMLTVFFMTGAATCIFPVLFMEVGKCLDQTQRYLSRYFLHVFYPVHLAVLWGLGFVFFPDSLPVLCDCNGAG